MQLTEEQILETLYDYSFKTELKGNLVGLINEANFKDVARQLLSKMQSKSEIAPPLQQAGVSLSLPLDFVAWYSGMGKAKILKAYERYKAECGNAS